MLRVSSPVSVLAVDWVVVMEKSVTRTALLVNAGRVRAPAWKGAISCGLVRRRRDRSATGA
jgi:hypothetical protein